MPFADRPTAGEARALTLALYLGAPLGYGILSLLVRQDYNWDLLNYHYYNPFAWLTGRRDLDIDAPVMPGAYFNPLLHLPFYLAFEHLPPRLTGFLVGAVQGLNAILVFWIARAALPGAASPGRDVAALALGLVGTIAAGNLGEIGTSFADNILSLFVLGALAMLALRAAELTLAIAAVAGALLGLACGLKPTMFLYGAGLGLACLAAPATWPRRIALAVALSAGAVIGYAVTGGFWALDLWQRFGNPMFPFFNDWFRSPFAAPEPHKNLVYLPRTWWDAATLAFRFPFNARLVGEVRFVDLRIPLLHAVAIAAVILAPLAKRRLAGPPRPAAVLVLAMLAGSYGAWVAMFAIYRYLIALEMLAPLGIVLLLGLMGLDARRTAATAAALLALCLVTLRVAGWGHVPWSDARFGVEAPALAEPGRTMVVLPGTEPTAFVVPAFPRAVRFVRVSRWILDSPAPPTGLERLAYDAVARHEGPIFALFRASEHGIAEQALKLRGLAIAPGACGPLVVRAEASKRDGLAFCRVARVP
ncbi:MAG: hypothetical protein IT562_18705 [Alphaproteobacteria bacterium]|nr:hypothetical protein [Alphaproteobacteria bacterium]